MIPPLDELVARANRAVVPGRRTIIGIAGAPGAGKSTLAAEVAAAAGAVVVPMDGFHLTTARLRALGRLERKGAADTFDVAGYVALLRRLRTDDGETRAPAFDRGVDEPVADAITVPARAIVITEGNYLLLADGPWAAVRRLLDDAWFVEIDDALRVRRLVERHVAFGRPPAVAEERVRSGSDGVNARLVAGTRSRADLVVSA